MKAVIMAGGVHCPEAHGSCCQQTNDGAYYRASYKI